MAIVVGITGLVLGAAWVAFDSINKRRHVLQATQQIMTIVQNARQLYRNQSTFGPGANITASLLNAGVFPSDMVVAGVPQNPWGTGNPGADIPNTGVTLANSVAPVGYGVPCNALATLNILQIVYWGIPSYAANGVLYNFLGNAAGAPGNNVICAYCDGGFTLSGAALTAATPTGLPACGEPANLTLYFKK